MAPDLSGLVVLLTAVLGVAFVVLLGALAATVVVVLREDRPVRLARHETRTQYWGHLLLGV